MRPSKIQNYMEIAETIAKRSHDDETKVGSVLVNPTTGAIMATGYNGFVRSAPDRELPTTRPDKYEYIIHSELNVITNAARTGVSTEGGVLYCTMSPCMSCTRLLFNCGITLVVAKELYKDFDQVLKMKDIWVRHYDSSDGLHTIKYEARPADHFEKPWIWGLE